MKWKQVTRDQFIADIYSLDVIGSIQPTPYPYTMLHYIRGHRDPIGKTVDRDVKGVIKKDYYVVDNT